MIKSFWGNSRENYQKKVYIIHIKSLFEENAFILIKMLETN